MKKILILNAGLDQAVAIAKFLKTYSEVHITACTEHRSKKNIFLIQKKYYDKLIVKDYLEALKTDNYDAVIPTGGYDTEKLLSLKKKIEVGKISFKIENLFVSNKTEMLNFVSKLGVPIPETFNNIEEICDFPVFFKQKEENSPKALGIIKSKKELNKIHRPTNLYQEYITHPSTFGVGFLAKDGNIICCFAHEELISFPKIGGSAVFLQKSDDQKIIEYTHKILKELKYTGWGLAEYKYCEKKKDFVFMEINAKFWASLEFALYNEPKFCKELFNINYKKENIDTITYIHRLLGTKSRLVFKNFREIIKSKKAVTSFKRSVYMFFRNIFKK